MQRRARPLASKSIDDASVPLANTFGDCSWRLVGFTKEWQHYIGCDVKTGVGNKLSDESEEQDELVLVTGGMCQARHISSAENKHEYSESVSLTQNL